MYKKKFTQEALVKIFLYKIYNGLDITFIVFDAFIYIYKCMKNL